MRVCHPIVVFFQGCLEVHRGYHRYRSKGSLVRGVMHHWTIQRVNSVCGFPSKVVCGILGEFACVFDAFFLVFGWLWWNYLWFSHYFPTISACFFSFSCPTEKWQFLSRGQSLRLVWVLSSSRFAKSWLRRSSCRIFLLQKACHFSAARWHRCILSKNLVFGIPKKMEKNWEKMK